MAALWAGFVCGFGGAVDPLDVIAALGLFGFRIPFISAAGFKFFAEFGGFQNQRRTALGAFFIQSLGFNVHPLDVVAAFGCSGVGIPDIGAAAAKLAAGLGFDDVAQRRTAFGTGILRGFHLEQDTMFSGKAIGEIFNDEIATVA